MYALLRIVPHHEAYKDIGIEADHRFLLPARTDLLTAALRIASSISSIVTIRFGLGRMPTNSLRRENTGVMTTRF